MIKILMVASEAVPYAKTGGLADVAGILPKFLRKLGHDARLVIPRYYGIDRDAPGVKHLPGALGVPMGIIGEMWCGVYESTLPGSDTPVYFIDHEQYFGRGDLYNEADGSGYVDNDNRFVFLSAAALQLCKKIGFQPDVVHVNDWHTAAIPVFLNTRYANDPLGQAASLLTIHNMRYQGRFYSGLMNVLDVGWEHFNYLELEWNDMVNLLKGGLYHATLVNSVSPKYASEIQTPEFGESLEGVTRQRDYDLYGVLNGMDYEEWNPATDPYIAANYDVDDLSGKAECKRALQREMGLHERDVPLIGMVSRLVHQKGIDIVAAAIERILGMDVQMVMLGSGQGWAHYFFPGVAARHPDRFACRIGYDNPLCHRIEAGSDFFLMPSRFEPCGLNQMYSLRYGTLPIVHAVGGLDDTVKNFEEHSLEGTGFKFHNLNPGALFDTVGWAVHTWYNRKDAMAALIANAMAERFSWESSALAYVELYKEAIKRRTGRIVNGGPRLAHPHEVGILPG